jgi:hypothetical protein
MIEILTALLGGILDAAVLALIFALLAGAAVLSVAKRARAGSVTYRLRSRPGQRGEG